MATRVQNRRGSTAEHSTFTGAVGEVTVDTDKEVVVVHDGTTAGGYPQMRENGSQNLVTTGSITGGRFIPTSSTVPTNGLYLPSAGSVAISTGGSGRLFVDASGNVSIGTTSTAGFGRGISVNGTTYSYYDLYADGAIYGRVRANLNEMALLAQGVSSYLTLGANNIERLRITAAGLVGIGTSTPQASLDIASGTFQAVRTNLSSVTDTFHQYRGTPDGVGYEHARVFSGRDTSVHTYGSYLAFYTEGKASGTTDTSLERLRIDSLGRVGIGTTSPVSLLHINGTGSTPTYSTVGNLNGGVQFGVDSSGIPVVSNYTDGPIRFGKFSSSTFVETMRIDSSGRLGIGTTSPSYTLDVAGSINANATVRTSNGTHIGILGSEAFAAGVVGVGSTSNHPLVLGTNSTERLRITSAGLVGVGTSSPSFTAHVSGAKNTTQLFVAAPTISAVNDFTQIGFGLSNTEFGLIRLGFDNPSAITNSYFGFFNNTGSGLQESLRIDSSGRVGIGTSSPSASLSVASTTTAYTATSFNIGEPSTSTGRQLYMGYNTTDGVGFIQPVHWGTEFKPLVLCPNGGRVGIGTINTTAKLTLGNLIDSTPSAVSQLHLYNDLAGVIAGFGVSSSQLNYRAPGAHVWIDGTTERARIDSSGRLLVGTSSFSGEGTIVTSGSSAAAAGQSIWVLQRGQTLPAPNLDIGIMRFEDFAGNRGAEIAAQTDGGYQWGANDYPARLVFSTTSDGQASPSPRVTIDNAGNTRFNSDSNSATANPGVKITSSTTIPEVRTVVNTADGGITNYSYYNTNATYNGYRFYVKVDGGIANHSVNNINLSDRNVKKDISLAAGTWNCIKEWEIVNYRYKDQPDDSDLNLGVIAQQVAESCPEVITVFEEAKDDQPEKLGIKEQQMYWMAIKALQEAMERIEILEAKVAALESA